MKTQVLQGFVLVLVLLGSNSSAAFDSLPDGVLAEIATRVAFAPEKDQGIYRFQILTSGEVREVDNSGEVDSLAVLGAEYIALLRAAIEAVEQEGLAEAVGPMCFDAPTVVVQVNKPSTLETKLVQTTIACKTSDAVDANARQVAKVIHLLRDALQSFRGLSP